VVLLRVSPLSRTELRLVHQVWSLAASYAYAEAMNGDPGVGRKTRPKDIGTKAETDVVNWARNSHGFLYARRIVQYGNKDQGDVTLCNGVMVQVKDGYTQGRPPTDYLIGQWLEKLDDQKKHGEWEHALLAHKRKGNADPDAWRWFIDGHTFMRLVYPSAGPGSWPGLPPYIQLQGYMVPPLLRNAGY
jgi:hypothetical protein